MREAYLWYADQLRVLREDGTLTPETAAELGLVETPERFTARQPKVHVVYYVRIGDHIKIGTTTAFGSRMMALMPDEILAIEEGDHRVEKARLRQFDACKAPKGREYFWPAPELVAHIAEVKRIDWRPPPEPFELPTYLSITCPSCDLLALWADKRWAIVCQYCTRPMSAEEYRARAEPLGLPVPGAS